MGAVTFRLIRAARHRWKLWTLLVALAIVRELAWDRFAEWVNPEIDKRGPPVISQVLEALIWVISLSPPMTFAAMVVAFLAFLVYREERNSSATPSTLPRSVESGAKGWLDHYVDALRDLKAFSSAMNSVTRDMSWVNKRIVKHTKDLARAKNNHQRMHKYTQETGDDLLEFARRLSLRNVELETTADAPQTFALYLEQSPGEARNDELDRLKGQITDGLATARSFRESTASLRTSMEVLRRRNVSADLNHGVDAAIETVGRHGQIMRRLERSLETLLTAIARTKAAKPIAAIQQSTPDTPAGPPPAAP